MAIGRGIFNLFSIRRLIPSFISNSKDDSFYRKYASIFCINFVVQKEFSSICKHRINIPN